MSRLFVLGRFAALFFFVLVFSTTCAHAKGAPDWVKKGQDKNYPSVRYLIGIGSGSSLDAARESARGELAKQFTVKIEAVLESEQSSESVRNNNGFFVQDREKTRDMVRTKSDETLQGVQVAASYVDEKKGLTYALAVLERGPAEERLESRIGELDTQIEAQLTASRNTAADKMTRLRALTNSRQLLNERAILNGQLMVIDRAGQGQPSSVDRVKLAEAIREALATIKVYIDAQTPMPSDMRTGVEETISKVGLGTCAAQAEADLVLHVELSVTLTDRKEESGFIYGEGVLNATLESRLPNQPAYASRLSAKDGGKNEAEATRKAQRRLREKLITELKKNLTDYLTPKI